MLPHEAVSVLRQLGVNVDLVASNSWRIAFPWVSNTPLAVGEVADSQTVIKLANAIMRRYADPRERVNFRHDMTTFIHELLAAPA